MIMNSEKVRIWKEVVAVYLNGVRLLWNLFRETGRHHEKP
jgi:hypothetical protein